MKKHNEYPTKYHKVASEVLNEYKSKQLYTFTRAGHLKTPMYTHSLWAGDQNMNFKPNTGLPSCLKAMLSSGLVGYSNTHCDIGGYTSFSFLNYPISQRTPILMTRWMQLAAFSPVFRTHEGNAPDDVLQVYSYPLIAEEFAFYSQIYAALSTYRKQQAHYSEQYKLPLVRPLFL